MNEQCVSRLSTHYRSIFTIIAVLFAIYNRRKLVKLISNSSALDFCTSCFSRKKRKARAVLPEKPEPELAMEPVGLPNIQVNCYLNAVLQALASCDTFVEFVKRQTDRFYYIVQQHGNINITNNLMTNIAYLLRALNGEITVNDSDHSMIRSIQFVFSEWERFGQQDALEMMIFMLNKLEKLAEQFEPAIAQLNAERILPNLPIPNILQLQSRTFCCSSTCEYTSSCKKVEKEFCLNLCFPVSYQREDSLLVRGGATHSLTQLLDMFFRPLPVLDMTCPACGRADSPIRRVVSLAEGFAPPPLLVLHIQRSVWSPAMRMMIKLGGHVAFPAELRLPSWYWQAESVRKFDPTRTNVAPHREGGEGGEREGGAPQREEQLENLSPLLAKLAQLEEFTQQTRQVEQQQEEEDEEEQEREEKRDKTKEELAAAAACVASNKESRSHRDNRDNNNEHDKNDDDDDDKNDEKDDEKDDEKEHETPRYKLRSLVRHWGLLDSGHYTGCRLVQLQEGGAAETQQWFATDDEQIRRVSEDYVHAEQAYILYYELIKS